MQHVFNFAARNVGKKIKYSQFSSHDQSVTIKKDVQLLCMARVLSKVIHSHCSGLPLQADIEEKTYKLIFLDVGRWTCLARCAKRNLPYLFRSRPGLPEKCPELIIIPRLLKLIWRFPRYVGKPILDEASSDPRYRVVSNSQQLDEVLLRCGILSQGGQRPGRSSILGEPEKELVSQKDD